MRIRIRGATSKLLAVLADPRYTDPQLFAPEAWNHGQGVGNLALLFPRTVRPYTEDNKLAEGWALLAEDGG